MEVVRTKGGFEVLKGVCAVLQGATVFAAKILCLYWSSEQLNFQEGAGRLEGTLKYYRYYFVEDW